MVFAINLPCATDAQTYNYIKYIEVCGRHFMAGKMAAIGGRSVFVAALSFVSGAVACKLWGGELKDRGKVCTQQRNAC